MHTATSLAMARRTTGHSANLFSFPAVNFAPDLEVACYSELLLVRHAEIFHQGPFFALLRTCVEHKFLTQRTLNEVISE